MFKLNWLNYDYIPSRWKQNIFLKILTENDCAPMHSKESNSHRGRRK